MDPKRGRETKQVEANSNSKPIDIVVSSQSVLEIWQQPILSHPTPSRPSASYLDRFGDRIPPAQALDSKYQFILEWVEGIDSSGYSEGYWDTQLPTSSSCIVPHMPASAALAVQSESEGISISHSEAERPSAASAEEIITDWSVCQKVYLEANKNLLRNIYTTSAAFVLMPSYVAECTGHKDRDATSPGGSILGQEQVTASGKLRELDQATVGCEGFREQLNENLQASDAV
jgi:hypothetical protein